MSRFPVKPLVFCAGAALLLSSCGNPFGASTDSGSSSQAARSSSSSSSSSASTSASASPTHSPTASATSSSASPNPSVSVVTVTANPQPETSTVTVTASSNSNSGSSSSSGRLALDSNASKLRGHHSWSLSSADTSTFDSSAELSWITVGSSDGASHIMLFHHGDYLGTGTLNPVQGSPSVSRNSANQISASVGSSQATFTWDSAQEKIVMNGDLPTG